MNPNWSAGGDRRSVRKKPLALNTKTQPDMLNMADAPEPPAPLSQDSFHIGNADELNDPTENDGPEDPIDAPEGLEDPLDEELAYQEAENGDDNDDSDEDEIDDESMDTEEIRNSTRGPESIDTAESIVLNMSTSFLKGRVLLLPVEDGETEIPLCCLCHQIAEPGEDMTNLLENRLRNQSFLFYFELWGVPHSSH